jgi:hypothetical protein
VEVLSHYAKKMKALINRKPALLRLLENIPVVGSVLKFLLQGFEAAMENVPQLRSRESFFMEDDQKLLSFYYKERFLSYPFPTSSKQIPYVEFPGLYGVSAASLIVRELPEFWVPPLDIMQYTQPSFDSWKQAAAALKIYEGNNARCVGIDAVAIHVQRVRFEDYIRTNLILDHRVGTRHTLRERLHSDGSLDFLETSKLAIIIGINIIIVNAAGDVPLLVRSHEVAVRPGQVCSSASGAFEIGDVFP